MDQEMENIKSHNVCELVPRMPGMRTLRLGWVLHRKFKNGVFEKNKGRLVARGNHQRPVIDYGESFFARYALRIPRTILALAAIRGLDIVQFDITSAYLHGALKEDVYMEQPEGYVTPGKEYWVWRLRKGLYGLVQAERTWNEELNTHMVSKGFTATPKDPDMYTKNGSIDRDFAAAGFWVDDCAVIGCREQLTALEQSVDAKYVIAGLGGVRWVLGMLPERDRSVRTTSMSQGAFIDSVFIRFNLTGASTVATPLTPGTQHRRLPYVEGQDRGDGE